MAIADREKTYVSAGDFEYGEELVHVYRRLGVAGMGGIDFDIAPVKLSLHHRPISTVEQALGELWRLRKAKDLDSPFGEYMRSKAQASLVYTQAASSGNFGLREYASRTMGTTPKEVSDQEIADGRTRVEGLFSELGYHKFDKSGWLSFFMDHHLEPDDIPKALATAESRIQPMLLEILGIHASPPYKTQIVDEPDTWINWTSGTPRGFLRRVNTNSMNWLRWFNGIEEMLEIHEPMHLLQSFKWKTNIKEGVISPGYGVTTVPGPEQWQGEGIAMDMAFLFPDLYNILTPFGKFATELSYFNELVYNRAHLDINKSNADWRVVTEFVEDLLPNEPIERIGDQLGKRAYSTRHRSYLLCYGDGERYFRSLVNVLSEAERIELVRELCEQPMTPVQIRAKVRKIREDSRQADGYSDLHLFA